MHTLPTQQSVRHDLFRLIRNGLLALFLVPLAAIVFIVRVQSGWESDLADGAGRTIGTDSARARVSASVSVSAAPASPGRWAVQATPLAPSPLCAASAPALAGHHAGLCGRFGAVWQFHLAGRVVGAIVLLEVVLCVALVALAHTALGGRAPRTPGLALLAWSSALVVVAQSVLLVWLSYWATTVFFHGHWRKLLVLIGVAMAAAAIAAVLRMFARISGTTAVDGELLRPEDAPALWTRVQALASQLGAAAPLRIVAGIEANFFVTEAMLLVQGRSVRGRTLYVSLPLLRVLDQREADAVLAHELAHFRSGHTGSGAALGPKLARFDSWCASMGGRGLTLVGYHLLVACRTVFGLALMRESRARELMADRAAAACVHPLPLVRALVKVAAYSSYREGVERTLFDSHLRHQGALGIAASVAAGLAPFARSAQFRNLMAAAEARPFDSHPRLRERMDNVGCIIAEHEFGALLAEPVLRNRASDIPAGAAIEARLWAGYEERFVQLHEQHLAWRRQGGQGRRG